MLSSLAHQSCDFTITVDVSCLKDAGDPTTESVCELYQSDKLIINVSYYDLETLQYRGLTRNDAIERCKTDWLLFADCDMVYHPHYMQRLIDHVQKEPCIQDHMFKAGRFSNDIDKANEMVAAEQYDKRLHHPWKRADRRLNKIKRANVGAGYFQLIHATKCDHGGYYVKKEKNRDHGWISGPKKWAKANSDRQFRRRIGKVSKLPRWFSQNQIHINHNRDNMFKKHLNKQR
jgi:glycosyltransferase involved in cell wall biosynthesis